MENGQTAGQCLKKNQKWLITFILIKLRHKFVKTLRNGYNNMCHMLIFVKSKNNFFFENLFDLLIEFFKILPIPYTLTIKVRGLNVSHYPISTLKEKS